MYYIGLDIGGTKCAASLGMTEGRNISLIDKTSFKTEKRAPYEVLEEFNRLIISMLRTHALKASDIKSIGISCGGPLDSRLGIIKSPPNLPGWDDIKVTDFFYRAAGIKSYLQNDANACAVAEWKYGAGQGYDNIVFLTFGTGLGAGLILNGKLYSGTGDNAGEIGHVRLTDDGPTGYNKTGSAEGWCSGGGLAQLGKAAVEAALENGVRPRLLDVAGSADKIDAKLIGDLAENENDPMCIEIYRTCAKKLGRVMGILSDIIDPDIFIVGGIYLRSAKLIYGDMMDVYKSEALICRPVLPAGLGEKVGDYAALSVAVSCSESERPV